MNSATIKKERKLSKTKTNRLIFYSIFIAVPVIHFLVFYVYININSILMSFKEYELTGAQGYVAVFAGFKNFAAAWQGLVSRGFMVKNSLIFLASDCLIITPLAVLFSFYLYRQAPLSGFFKAILFMPQLLSGVILGLLYKYIASDVYLWLADKLNMTVSGGLLDTVQTQLGASLAFNIFMGFGVNVLLFVGAMSGVNAAVVESSEIDGATTLVHNYSVDFHDDRNRRNRVHISPFHESVQYVHAFRQRSGQNEYTRLFPVRSGNGIGTRRAARQPAFVPRSFGSGTHTYGNNPAHNHVSPSPYEQVRTERGLIGG